MKYRLHYVGSRLYPERLFIEEAKKLGVNRCLPLRHLKSMKFGDKILLATFIPKTIENKPKQLTFDTFAGSNNEIDGRKNRKDGTAKIFGYFTISGINLRASDEFKEALMSKLEVVEAKENNVLYQRQCGTYLLGTTHIITNTLAEVVNHIEQLILERKEMIKVFISGTFTDLKAEISPISFSRTIIAVDIIDEIPFEDVINVIGYIYNYEKRLYIKKYAHAGRPKKEKK